MVSIDFSTVSSLVASKLTQVRERIQARMDNAGVNASGRTRASFKVRIVEDGVELVGGGGDAAPIDTLEVGRQGGKVPYSFTDVLVQWSKDKGLSFDTEAQRRSFAYLLGRRIAREGTLRHTNQKDIYSSIVSDAQDDLQRSITEIISQQVVSVVKNYTTTTAKQRTF